LAKPCPMAPPGARLASRTACTGTRSASIAPSWTWRRLCGRGAGAFRSRVWRRGCDVLCADRARSRFSSRCRVSGCARRGSSVPRSILDMHERETLSSARILTAAASGCGGSSKTDRFAPESGRTADFGGRLKSANCRHVRRDIERGTRYLFCLHFDAEARSHGKARFNRLAEGRVAAPAVLRIACRK
jgi:hypothetical protein